MLERRGGWLGYTAARRARVNALFARWGALTILITRTFASYLSPPASAAAGASGYGAVEFFAFTLLGRAAWTAAYLGLGYAVGTEVEAAASFLANVTGLFLCLLLAAGCGLMLRREFDRGQTAGR